MGLLFFAAAMLLGYLFTHPELLMSKNNQTYEKPKVPCNSTALNIHCQQPHTGGGCDPGGYRRSDMICPEDQICCEY